MKISLSNFRQYKNYEVEFPDKGLILLRGASGAGKSTLMESIYFAITGECGSVTPWTGEKPTTVTLEINGMTITRTHNPVSLSVIFSSGSYSGEAAQAEIYKFMGITEQEFMAAYYVRQRQKGSLLSLGQADQLRFIQRLAFGDQDPEKFKEKIKLSISEKANDVKLIESEISNINHNIELTETRIRNREAELGTAPQYDGEDIAVLDKELEASNNKIKACKIELSQLNDLLDHPAAKAFRKYVILKDSHHAQQLERQKKIEKTKHLLLDNNKASADLTPEELDEKINDINGKIKYLEWRKELDDFSKNVKEAYPEFTSGASTFIQEKINNLTKESDIVWDHNTNQLVLQSDLKCQEVIKNCPECGTGLYIENNVLHKSEHQDLNLIREKQQNCNNQIKQNETRLKEIDTELVRLHKFLDRAEALKISKPKSYTPAGTLLEAKQQLGELVLYKQIRIKQSIYAEQYQKEILSLQKEMDNAGAEMFNITKTIEEYADEHIPTDEEINKKRQMFMDKINSEDENKNKTLSLKTEYQQFVASKQVYDTRVSQITELKSELTELKKPIDDLTDKLNTATSCLQGYVRLRDISDSAAIKATEAIIHSINDHANKHIQNTFPDGGVSVRILSGAKTQKGEERAKLSLAVTHVKKGLVDGKHLDSFSGGEQDRVKVAFQLGLAEIYNALFMIIDEPFAGLDTENTLEICFGLLKKASQDKLIVVAQHGAPYGVADMVVDI
jgi:DNA repair protein SbcC/Rad50